MLDACKSQNFDEMNWELTLEANVNILRTRSKEEDSFVH